MKSSRADWRRRAKTLLDWHGLTDWSVAYDTKKRVLGSCEYATKTIWLSVYTVDSLPNEEIEDTILHEIAHALTPGAKHGLEWALAAEAIGARPEACYEGGPIAKPKYKLVCSQCAREYFRYRMPSSRLYCCQTKVEVVEL